MNSDDHVKNEVKPQESSRPINRIGVGITFGAVVGWILSVSMNGFFNFHSANPAVQLYPFCFAVWLCVAYTTWNLVVRYSNLPWLYMVAAIVCVTLFFVTTKAVDKRMAELGPEPPWIDLDVGPVIDPKDPFGTSLIIHNAGKIPISNIWSRVYWNDPSVKTLILGEIAVNPVTSLLPTMKQGMHFARPDFTSPKSDFPPFGSRTFVNVEVRYTPEFARFETNQLFQFCVYKDKDGNYLWIPDGEGESEKAISSRLSQESQRVIDIVPFLEVQIVDFENLPQDDKDYPIKISYSWKNTGGAPAAGVYIEWAALYTNYHPRMAWNHHGEGFAETLWPGMTTNTARFYMESPEHDVFDGVMNGKYILSGTALFKDLESHMFAMQIRAVRTNGRFETKIVGLGGYFTTLAQEADKTNAVREQSR